jgi:hypothetical protein
MRILLTTLALLDHFIQLHLFLFSDVREMDDHLITKFLAYLLKRQAFGFWEEIPNERNVDRGENDEEEVIFPSDLSKGRWCCFQVCDGRQEQDGQSKCDTTGTNVGWKDLRDIHERIGVDTAAITDKSKLGNCAIVE